MRYVASAETKAAAKAARLELGIGVLSPGNSLKQHRVDAMHAMLKAGATTSSIISDLHISQPTVLKYRRKLFSEEPPPNCACGKIAGHRGVCLSSSVRPFRAAVRLSRHTAAIRVATPIHRDLRYPFVLPEGPPNRCDLLLLVNGLVPRGLPEQLRGDVCQDIIVAVLEGELQTSEIPAQLARFIALAKQNAETDRMAVSLDQPRRDGTSWHDVLVAP